MQAVNNLRGGRRVRVALPFLPALVAPLALVGFTVPGTGGIAQLNEALEAERARVERSQILRSRVEAFGELSQLEDLALVRERLRTLVPVPETEIQLFNRLRFLGDLLDLELSRNDIKAPVDLGLVVDGETVELREIALTGKATLGALVDLLAHLRDQGVPATVLEASLSRGDSGERKFQFDLRIGVFQRVPARAVAPVAASHGDIPDPGAP